MEFKDFVEKRKRMCKHYSLCHGCPLNPIGSHIPCADRCLIHYELAEEIVDHWAKDNPILTNAAKFKEVFGVDIDYSLDNPGYLYISKLIQIASPDKIEDIKKWLESEYITHEEKQND